MIWSLLILTTWQEKVSPMPMQILLKFAAEKLGLRFFLKEIDVEDKRVQFKKSFQETARLIRYQFFDETLKVVGGNKIALGHSADDRVETTLMNIIRGSGLKGLAGIPQVRGNIIRPFWEIYRKELGKLS